MVRIRKSFGSVAPGNFAKNTARAKRRALGQLAPVSTRSNSWRMRVAARSVTHDRSREVHASGPAALLPM
eukprot:1048519-Alexandrium_andersonii.AAC.1